MATNNKYYCRGFVDQESMHSIAVSCAQGLTGFNQGGVRLKKLSGARGFLLSSHGWWKN